MCCRQRKKNGELCHTELCCANEQGCHIFVRVIAEDNVCTVVVADDGIGATDEQIEKLNNTPHYMVCDEKTTEQRHGLGLLIVKQIIFAHNGKMLIRHSEYGGFEAALSLPTAIGLNKKSL